MTTLPDGGRRAAPGPKRLLIVDDDHDFRTSMALEFTDRGYQVHTAADSREALGLAALHRPQFAAIDLRLGGERGLELLQEMMVRLPEVVAVVLTGYGSVATAVEAVKLGARHYLTKPVDPDQIEAAFARPEKGDPTVEVAALPQSLAKHEREYIEYVLASTGGNISEAARRLGLHRQSLQRKLRKYPPRR
jgi:two-component system response regulator RegA